LLVSGSRDKVLNFYELDKLVHIKTIAVMEEIEGVEILSDDHSNKILGVKKITKPKKGSNSIVQNIVITGGKNGIIKLYKIEINGNDVSSFAYELLFQIPLSNVNINSGNSYY
jgi:hypothetical protein